jgi:hypothetical protein
MAARVEKARGFLASLILAPQVVEGMGGEVETARILGSVETVVAHRVNTPDQIVALAGTRNVPALTTRLSEDGLTRDRSVRMEQRPTIDPNKVRGLEAGAAYLINHGRAMKIKVPRAPNIRVPLPQAHPTPSNVAKRVPSTGASPKGVADLPF